MGSETCRTIQADPDTELVARVGSDDPIERLAEAGTQVAVDFTVPAAVKENVRFCLARGIHVVIGATGLDGEDLAEIERWCADGGANALYAPNFALGAVLMMELARRAAPFFDRAEIVERHHDKKLDAPSGTALRTAALMNEARPEGWPIPSGGIEPSDPSRGRYVDGVAIHSVRLPGLMAHQEVVFAGPGETLTIRHDSLDRASFMPGVLLAIKSIDSRSGLTVGLENLLEL